jgi:hypothetical protein
MSSLYSAGLSWVLVSSGWFFAAVLPLSSDVEPQPTTAVNLPTETEFVHWIETETETAESKQPCICLAAESENMKGIIAEVFGVTESPNPLESISFPGFLSNVQLQLCETDCNAARGNCDCHGSKCQNAPAAPQECNCVAGASKGFPTLISGTQVTGWSINDLELGPDTCECAGCVVSFTNKKSCADCEWCPGLPACGVPATKTVASSFVVPACDKGASNPTSLSAKSFGSVVRACLIAAAETPAPEELEPQKKRQLKIDFGFSAKEGFKLNWKVETNRDKPAVVATVPTKKIVAVLPKSNACALNGPCGTATTMLPIKATPRLCAQKVWTNAANRLVQNLTAVVNPQPEIRGHCMPSSYYLDDDVQYFPAGPEFKLSREHAAAEMSKDVQCGAYPSILPAKGNCSCKDCSCQSCACTATACKCGDGQTACCRTTAKLPSSRRQVTAVGYPAIPVESEIDVEVEFPAELDTVMEVRQGRDSVLSGTSLEHAEKDALRAFAQALQRVATAEPTDNVLPPMLPRPTEFSVEDQPYSRPYPETIDHPVPVAEDRLELETVNTMRDMSRHLEELANRSEHAGDYDRADQVRMMAEKLRLEARKIAR